MSDPTQDSQWLVRCGADYDGHIRVYLQQTEDPFLRLAARRQVADIDMAARVGAWRVTSALRRAHRMARRRNKALAKASRYFEHHESLNASQRVLQRKAHPLDRTDT